MGSPGPAGKQAVQRWRESADTTLGGRGGGMRNSACVLRQTLWLSSPPLSALCDVVPPRDVKAFSILP